MGDEDESSRVLFGGPDAGGENPNQFLSLEEEETHSLGGKKLHSGNETEPPLDLLQLFVTNTELVDEVFAGFGGLNFAVIRERRSSAAQQLASDVIPGARSRQGIDQGDEPRRDLEQPILEIKLPLRAVFANLGRVSSNFSNSIHASLFANAFFLLNVKRWTLDVGRFLLSLHQ
jgi:hypothetical protein